MGSRGRSGRGVDCEAHTVVGTVMIHLSAHTSPGVNPPGNHTLWAMRMCQGRFTDVPRSLWWGTWVTGVTHVMWNPIL